MHEHADAAHMPLPAAELLVERGVGDDPSVHAGQQGKDAAEVDVAAPVADDFRLGDAVFDEHPFLRRAREEKFMKGFFVVGLKRAELAGETGFERDVSGIFFERVFDHKIGG